MITLHVFPPSPRSFKVLALAEHLGIEHRVRIVDLAKGEQDTPGFAKLNPNLRVPVLEEDGFVLWESNAILQYLASKKPDSGMLPADPRAHADITRWQCWDLAHWDPACAILVFENVVKKLFGMGDPDPAEIRKGENRFHTCAAVLDAQLQGRKYITGNALTVADFSIGAPLNQAQPAGLPVGGYQEIVRWHAALSELPAWRKNIVVPPAS
jgi:glutathione S-transferase